MILTILIYIAIIVAVVSVDQVTKMILLHYDFTYIPHFLYNTPTINDGAAFSILGGKQVFLITFTLIVLIATFFILFTKKFSDNKFFKCSLAVTIGGIIGNLIDRIMIGAVRDFLLMEPFGFICNVADIAICVGVALICVYIVFIHKFKDDKKDKKTDGSTLDEETTTDVSTKNKDLIQNDASVVDKVTQKYESTLDKTTQKEEVKSRSKNKKSSNTTKT